MKFNLDQLKAELGVLVFARVLKVVDVPPTHYYAFADKLTLTSHRANTRIFFQKTKRRDCIHVGPVRYEGKEEAKPRDIVCGVVELLPKGPTFTWWISGASSLFHFTQYIHRQFTPKKHSKVLYQQLELPNQSDDLWALFLLVSGDVIDFVSEKLGKNRIRHPAKRLNQYQQKKGFELSRPVEEFVFCATLFAREAEIFEQFKTLCEKKGIVLDWTAYYDQENKLGGVAATS